MFLDEFPEKYLRRIVKPGRLEHFEDARVGALKRLQRARTALLLFS